MQAFNTPPCVINQIMITEILITKNILNFVKMSFKVYCEVGDACRSMHALRGNQTLNVCGVCQKAGGECIDKMIAMESRMTQTSTYLFMYGYGRTPEHNN